MNKGIVVLKNLYKALTALAAVIIAGIIARANSNKNNQNRINKLEHENNEIKSRINDLESELFGPIRHSDELNKLRVQRDENDKKIRNLQNNIA